MFVNERTVTWKFLNIDLPDSNSNEPQSHGYIEYSILPLQGLPDGTVIENSASIYFDFNSPVLTNIVQNTLQTNIVSLPELVNLTAFMVYPVPSSEEITIAANIALTGKSEISLYDLKGRIVKTFFKGSLQKGSTLHVSLAGIAKGIYFVKINSDNFFYVHKIVKE